MSEFEIITDYITPQQETELLRHLNAVMVGIKPLTNGLRSRILRWGYDYAEKTVKMEDAPEWLYPHAALRPFESVTVNQYLPGARIAPHVDSLRFGSPILVLSLGSPGTFNLHPPNLRVQKHAVPARSLISMSGSVREVWEHSVDKVVGGTRFSVVYRQRILKPK